MEQLLEIARQIQELSGVIVEALEGVLSGGAPGGEAPAAGEAPPEGEPPAGPPEG